VDHRNLIFCWLTDFIIPQSLSEAYRRCFAFFKHQATISKSPIWVLEVFFMVGRQLLVFQLIAVLKNSDFKSRIIVCHNPELSGEKHFLELVLGLNFSNFRAKFAIYGKCLRKYSEAKVVAYHNSISKFFHYSMVNLGFMSSKIFYPPYSIGKLQLLPTGSPSNSNLPPSLGYVGCFSLLADL